LVDCTPTSLTIQMLPSVKNNFFKFRINTLTSQLTVKDSQLPWPPISNRDPTCLSELIIIIYDNF
jgi:hypothetical protein